MKKDCWIGKKPLLTAVSHRQKMGACVWKTKKGKITKWMMVVDSQGIPLGSTLALASPAEVKLAEETLDAVKVPRIGKGRPKKRPARLIADKGYDSDPLRNRIKYLKIELISRHRSNHKKPKTQDG
jgi:hypothetical protein